MSFGGAASLSSALGAAGFDALTFKGEPQHWAEFGENQAINAAAGAVLGPVLDWGAKQGAAGARWAYRTVPGVAPAIDAVTEPIATATRAGVQRLSRSLGTGPGSILPSGVRESMLRFEQGTLEETGVLAPFARWHNRMQAEYSWTTPRGGHWSQGVSHQLRSELGLIGQPEQLHHWLIPQRAKLIPNYIKNARWNVVRVDRTAHAMIDVAFTRRGVTPYPLLLRPWIAMPPWARGAITSGLIPDEDR